MGRSMNPLARFFSVILRWSTYLNLIYLLLAFPLGLVYFLFFVVGISLGLALAVLLVGFLILGVVALGWYSFTVLERYMAIWLLGVEVPPMEKPGPQRADFWGRLSDLVSNPVTWKSLVFLIAKFPLGIFSFVVLVTLVSVSLALLIAPVTYWWLPLRANAFDTIWQIDTWWESLIAFVVGGLLGVASLHGLNYVAYVSGLFAKIMLGNPRPALAAPAAAPAAAQPVVPLEAEAVMLGAAPATPDLADGGEKVGSQAALDAPPEVTASLKPEGVPPSAETAGETAETHPLPENTPIQGGEEQGAGELDADATGVDPS